VNEVIKVAAHGGNTAERMYSWTEYACFTRMIYLKQNRIATCE
jgi:hypothetical protein